MSCNIYYYAVLAIVSNSYPRYQAGYLRVTHPFATHPEEQAPPSAFYLHVLGTPPAFVLSQDQTASVQSVWTLVETRIRIAC